MDQSIEDSFAFEDVARLSTWTGFQYFKMMHNELLKDTNRCNEEFLRAKAAAGSGSIAPEVYAELGFWGRNLTRSFMSYAEGILYVMRRLTIFAHERGEIELSLGEAMLVREKVYTFNTRRKRIKESEAPNRLLKNFVLTFSVFPRVFGSEFEVNYGDHGWEKFQALVRVRNALTHPKSIEDTLLSPELPNTLRDAFVWFYTNMVNFFNSVDVASLEEDFRRTAQMDEVRQLIRRRHEQEDAENSGQADG